MPIAGYRLGPVPEEVRQTVKVLFDQSELAVTSTRSAQRSLWRNETPAKLSDREAVFEESGG